MTHAKEETITSSERVIMRVVWTLGKVSSRQVADSLTETDWSPSTIKTLLARLEKKGFLLTTMQGNHKEYTACISENDASKDVGAKVKEQVCAMQVGTVVKEIIENNDISQTEINDIINLLNAKKENAPEYVECNCMEIK